MATTETPVQVLDITDEQLSEFGSEYAEQALVLQKELALEAIKDDATYQRVAQAGLDAAANIKLIEAYLNPLKERRHAAWKRVTTVIAAKTAPFEEVKKKAGQLVAKYQYEQEQARQAAEQAERDRLQKEEDARRAQEAEQLAKEGRLEEGLERWRAEGQRCVDREREVQSNRDEPDGTGEGCRGRQSTDSGTAGG